MTLPTGVEGNTGGIQVIYDDTVLREKVPYQVSVDQKRATLLLLNYGVPQEKVDQVKLLIQERPPEQVLDTAEGYFIGSDLTILMRPDVTFETMGRKFSNRPNHVFLHEAKHLINYLSSPGYERGSGRLFDRMGDVTLSTGGISLLIALGLALPDMFGTRNDQKVIEMVQQVGAFGVLYLPAQIAFYHLNPVELSAQRFAGRLNKNPQWQSIVTISPKGK